MPCPAPYNQPHPTVKFWNFDTESHIDNWVLPGVGNGWVDLQNGFGSVDGSWGASFGPELSFGRRIQELFPNDQIYLVKYGVGSTSLGANWNPATGNSYSMFKQRVDAAIQNLQNAGLVPSIEGMIWMQGEDDATNTTFANAYKTNLTNFVSAVRNDFSVPNMKFVAGRITWAPEIWSSHATVAKVRNAQETISSYISKSSWINTDDLEWACYEHYGTQGQIDLGNRFANQFAVVPEPSAFVLSLCAIAGMAFCLRWHR
jgi:hypothetical protein